MADDIAIHPSTPVIVGVGQCVDHWDGSDAASAPSPISLARSAGRLALADSGAGAALAGCIDQVTVVRTMLDSVPGTPQPFGRCANMPATLAAALGIKGARHIYSQVGGDRPQGLVNEAAEAIFAGDAAAILLAGAEATAAMKLALKRRQTLDWSASVGGDVDDRGLGPMLLADYDRQNGLGAPTQTYPAFEQALRRRLGHSIEGHAQVMAELWSGFSRVAAANPYAQFPIERSSEWLCTESPENYRIADPYLKWHVAQDAVNQGAAIILTSYERAIELGIDPDRCIFLHGYASATDRSPSERPDYATSRAIDLALRHALDSAGLTAADIGHYDIYSCFPCVVLLAAETLGVDWRAVPLTVTGGLPFFGGAGNNYSMHAIATMVERLRARPDDYGLVLANGGFMTKEAVGIYSARPRANWAPISSAAIQQAIDSAPVPQQMQADCTIAIDTYSITWKKGAPDRAYVASNCGGVSVLARARSDHRATMRALAEEDRLGQPIAIVHDRGVNYIDAGPIGSDPGHGGFARRFDHVLVARHGHVLEVTINRPGSMNALHSAAHFELHEIWDEFERDRDLWVAIITGAGDRAFSSGNDLKVTAAGGDMTMPKSGFGGLTSRFDREKPIIAAVNGIAMGGGLEIALACDLIVADEGARMALPEVKVGLFAAAGGVQRLTRQIGRKAAMEMILTGKSISAAEALALGIINRSVPAGTALTDARALANAIIANSPTAIRASKKALNALDAIEQQAAALEANGPVIRELMRSKDMIEGVTAFAQKRAPNWTNS